MASSNITSSLERNTNNTGIMQIDPNSGKEYQSIGNVNPKIYALGYDENFLVNAAMLILLNLVAWILNFIFGALKDRLQHPWAKFIVKIFHYNFVIVVFFSTAQEMTMLSFFHF